MTTEPSAPRATVTPPRQTTRVVSVSSPGTIIGGVLCIILGIALGVSNQAAETTPMGLRVPALLAALLLVGQSVVAIRRSLPRQQLETVVETGDGVPRGRELAVVRPVAQQPPVTTVLTTKPAPSTLAVPIAVLFLAAWLGLADLRVDSPPTLGLLSLVSSFVLFALGWQLLPARR